MVRYVALLNESKNQYFGLGGSMGFVQGLRSEMKNFEDPRGMRVYTRTYLILFTIVQECTFVGNRKY